MILNVTPWHESYEKPWQYIKIQRHHFANESPYSWSYVFFLVVMYRCESWTIKKTEHQRIDAFKLCCWRKLLRVPWTARRSNQSILKEIILEYSLEGLMLKLTLQYFGYLMWREDSLEKTLVLEKIEGKKAEGGSWWWIEKPGVLQSLGSQRVGHIWATEQQQIMTVDYTWNSARYRHHEKQYTGVLSASIVIIKYRRLGGFSSVRWLTLCNPMDCSMSGFPVHHQLPELTQTHVHWVGDAIQPSHPVASPSPALDLSQLQGLFQGVSSLHQVAKILEFQLQHQSFQWIFRTDFF